MKLKFKKGLVPICITYFLMFLGMGFSLPYMTLQLMSLGLTLADASLINGLGPIIGSFLTPLLGYAGDKLGYKLVLISSLFLFIVSTTALNFLPVYRQHSAKIGLDKTMYNDTLETFDSKSIVWFGKYTDLKSSCDYQASENVIKEIDCDGTVFYVDIEFNIEEIDPVNNKTCEDLDIQTCKFVIKEVEED